MATWRESERVATATTVTRPQALTPPGLDLVRPPFQVAVSVQQAAPSTASPAANLDLTIHQHYAREPRELDFVRSLRLAQNLGELPD